MKKGLFAKNKSTIVVLLVAIALVIILSSYGDDLGGAEVSYIGSRSDIPITLYLDNSLSFEDREADLFVQMQAAANEYGCPEQGGSNNALGPVQVIEERGNATIQVADVGCNDGIVSILFFEVIGGLPPN